MDRYIWSSTRTCTIDYTYNDHPNNNDTVYFFKVLNSNDDDLMKKVTYTCTGSMSQVQFSLMFIFVYSTKYNVYNAQCHSNEY